MNQNLKAKSIKKLLSEQESRRKETSKALTEIQLKSEECAVVILYSYSHKPQAKKSPQSTDATGKYHWYSPYNKVSEYLV